MSISPDSPTRIQPIARRPIAASARCIYCSPCACAWRLEIGVPAQLWRPAYGLAITEVVLVLPAIVYVRMKRLPLAESLGWRAVSPATALAGLLIGVAGFGAAEMIAYATTPIIGRGPEIEYFNSTACRQLLRLSFAALSCLASARRLCSAGRFNRRSAAGARESDPDHLGLVRADSSRPDGISSAFSWAWCLGSSPGGPARLFPPRSPTPPRTPRHLRSFICLATNMTGGRFWSQC